MMKLLLNLFFLLVLTFSFAQSNSSHKSEASLNLEWKSRGPLNISGITKAMLWDKNDENIIYSGGIASGLYKTSNKGDTWSKVDSYIDNNPSIASLAQSVNGTIFVGTGFGIGAYPNGQLYNLTINGNGIYKSDDSGISWTHINDTNSSSLTIGEWSSVNAMATHPVNTQLLMIGNISGVRISSNAESSQPTFTAANGITGNVTDVKFTNNGQEAWATANGRIYHSTDLANDFIDFNLNSPSGVLASRAQIAISNVDSNGDYIIYASFSDGSGCLAGIYKSEDKGINWIQILAPGGLDPFQVTNGGCQGWYSHSLAVNPIIQDILYIGGYTLHTITSSGDLVQIDDINNESASDYLPNDKHFILFNPNNGNEMIIGTDNGIYLSENAQTGYPYNISYTSKSIGLNNSISLNADIGKNGEILSSGYNNTYYMDYLGTNPYDASNIYADGNASAEISNYEENILMFSGTYGFLKRSLDKGVSYNPFLDNNIDPGGCDAITCVYMTPVPLNCEDNINMSNDFFNENYLYDSDTDSKFFVPTSCGSDFFVCVNPLNTADAPIYNSLQIALQSGTRSLDVSSDGDRLVLGSGARVIVLDGFDSYTPSVPDNTTTNTAQINIDMENLSSLGITNISGVSIDKNDKNHILVTEDGYGSNTKVAKTADGGSTWVIIHNDLPEIPIFDCIIDANNSSNYILATNEGIYTSDNGGQNWIADNSGMGKLPIFRIRQEWVLEEDCYVLLAATLGNGIYTSTTLTNCNKNVEEEIWGIYNSLQNVNKETLNLNIYPNPTKSKFVIELAETLENPETVFVYDVYGKQVYTNKIEKNLEIETSDWSAGVYYITIKNTTTKIIVLK